MEDDALKSLGPQECFQFIYFIAHSCI
jgi:hypothetical protein